MEQKLNRNITKYLYIISMTIAFVPRYGDIVPDKYIQLGIGMFWISYVLLELMIKKFRFTGEYKKDISWMLRSYFIPAFVLHMWTIVLMAIGVLSWENFTTNISTYIPILLAVSSVYIFGKNAFWLNFFALVAAYTISILFSVVLIGPKIIIDGLVKSFGGNGMLKYNYLELHDIVLSIGFVLTYFIFSREKFTSKNILIIASTVIIMILGLKRISLFGVFLAVVFHKVVKRCAPATQYKICRIAGMVAIVCCFIFVWILVAGDSFWEFAKSLGVDFMGRNYYWTAVAERCEFSPAFLGLGRNYSYLLFSGELSYMRVGAAHSDILKMYAENGFFLFAYWLWYYLMYMTKRYRVRFSQDSALVYFGITIYLFTLYITDNVETYFAAIIFSIIIPTCHALRYDRGQGNRIGSSISTAPPALVYLLRKERKPCETYIDYCKHILSTDTCDLNEIHNF